MISIAFSTKYISRIFASTFWCIFDSHFYSTIHNARHLKFLQLFTLVFHFVWLCTCISLLSHRKFFLFWKPRSYKCPSWLIAVVMLWSQGLLYHCTWWLFLAFQHKRTTVPRLLLTVGSFSSTEKRGNSKDHWTGELLIGPADQLSTNISMDDVVTYMYVNLLVVQYPLFTF